MIIRVAVVMALTSVVAFAQTTRESVQKKSFEITFDQRSPLSDLSVQRARYGLDRSPAHVYNLADERFSAHVPEEYDGSRGWGILVWGTGGEGGGGGRGGLADDWIAILAKKKLIFIAAHNAGNDRGVGVRIGLALDAVFNMRQRYALDEHRTYIGGVSGGGKIAEMAAMAFPDVFDGAIACAGANWYKDIAVPGKPNTAWPATFRRPPNNFFVDARDHVGFILITGQNDPNYLPMKSTYDQGFVGDKFKHVSFYDVPGLGHRAPPMEWIEKAIDELDALPKNRVKKLPATRPAAAATRASRAVR